MSERLQQNARQFADQERKTGGADRWRLVLAASIMVLVVAQAALAGQFLYRDAGALGVHRVIAEVVPVLALALVLVSRWPARQAPPSSRLPRVAAAILVLVIAQTGLGFVGRNSTFAAAVHVPLGVVIFGLVTYATVLTAGSSPVADK